MIIAFTWRRCIARLVQPRREVFRPYKPLRSLQTLSRPQAISGQPPWQPIIEPTERNWGPQPDLMLSKSPRVFSDSNSPLPYPPMPHETETNSTLSMTKYSPLRTSTVRQLARSPPTRKAHKLVDKIINAWGDYRLPILQRDMSSVYGLSRTESRHTIGQLQRLLWGYLGPTEAMPRLVRYLDWKKAFVAAKKDLASTLPSSKNTESIWSTEAGVDTGNTTFETASHDTEVASMIPEWESLDGDARELLWPQAMLSTLQSKPHIMLPMFQYTFGASWCPSYVVEDIIDLLICRYKLAHQRGLVEESSQMQHEVAVMGDFLLRNSPPRYVEILQSDLPSLSEGLSVSELIEHFELLKAIEHPLHPNTLLHFASRFAKIHNTKAYAADILRMVTDVPGFDLNTPAASCVCVSLLAVKEDEPLPTGQAAPDNLLEFLMKRGYLPTRTALVALMRNFCLRGHLDTAWNVFDIMLEQGFEPDQYVYSTLLNGSKTNLDDASLRHIFTMITDRNAWSPVLLNDYMGLLLQESESQTEQRRRQRKSRNAWRPMFWLYARHFDVRPLQKFLLFPVEHLFGRWRTGLKYPTSAAQLAETMTAQPDFELLQPDPTTLCLMIGAHMRSLQTSKYAINYYNNFFRLVECKDPTALSILAETGTQIHDIFLRTLMQFQSSVDFAIKQFDRMVKAADQEKEKYGKNIHHHPPSVYTWTIMINGFKNHNETNRAVASFHTMTNIYKVKPNLVTWNVMIQVYARRGSVKGVLMAVMALEKAGFRPDERTMKAISFLPSAKEFEVIAKLEEIREAAENPLGRIGPNPYTDQADELIDAFLGARADELPKRDFNSNAPLGPRSPAAAAEEEEAWSNNTKVQPSRPPMTADDFAKEFELAEE